MGSARRVLSALCLVALTGGLLVGVGGGSALADTRPADPSVPTTVSADGLPTAQMNGVAWAQLVVGNTVYVTGAFTRARPAGSPVGTNEVSRGNLLAYDITTGNLLPFQLNLNGAGRGLALSADGSTLYVVGNFTTAGGVAADRAVAISVATGKRLTSWVPNINSKTNAVVATANAVYLGGQFTAVNGVARAGLAAVDPTTGALLGWAPTADNGAVAAMTFNQAQTKLIVGGQFTSVNRGPSGYGLAALDPSSGAQVPWTVATQVRNGGSNAGIYALSTQGNQVFGTGWVFGSGGNFEGVFSADGDSGNVQFMEDCHGDSYGAYAQSQVVYVVSHEHNCATVTGGFPEASTRTWYRATAFTNYATGTLAHNTQGGYADWYGQPSPSMLDWFPTLAAGTYTGQSQAAWTITGNASYITLAGEFPTVNGVAQQGMVRFAVPSIAPNKIGPSTSTSPTPSVTSPAPGTVRLSWTASADRDNESLTYQVIRDGVTATPVYTTTALSRPWSRPSMTWTDQNLVPGSTHTYRVTAKDPWGNKVTSANVSVTVASGTASPYVTDVLNDGASNYWRLNDASGTTLADSAGSTPLTAQGGVTLGAAGPLGTTPGAATFNGASGSTAGSSTAVPGPNTFSVEGWFQTTTGSGGKIVGFGNSQLGTSGNYDRHVYLDNAGHVIFGVYPNAVRTLTSANTYNNGQWHQFVATLSSAGMVLYVDGRQVAADPNTTSAQVYSGYWRVGGDNLNGWPATPASQYFNGAIAEVSIYPTALSAAQVLNHWQATGRA